MKNYDIVVIGNCTEDRFKFNGKLVSKLGGSPSYIHSLLKALDVNVGVYSKIWSDFPFTEELPFKPLSFSEKKPLICRLHNNTTGKNHIFLVSSEKILPKEVDFISKISIITGVMQEVPSETIKNIRNRSDIIIVDAQMIMRGRNKEGNVVLNKLSKTPYKDVLGSIDYLKISENESDFLGPCPAKKPKILLTMGPKGCKIIGKTKEKTIPTSPLEETESNGSGDMFLAGFAYGLLNGCDEETSAKIGNYCGGLAVKAVGIPKLTKEELKTIKNMARNP